MSRFKKTPVRAPAGAATVLDVTRCHEAVRRRDHGSDGHFVYSVATTGVYCRPSCPAKRARRENIAFHAS